MTLLKKKIFLSVGLLLLVIITGTLGYSLIEGWDLFDSLYMTIITLATIGYTELHELSKMGRVFNIFLIFFGVGVVAYTVNNGIRFVFEGEIQDALGRRKLEKRIKELKKDITLYAVMAGWDVLYVMSSNQKKYPLL